MNTNDLLNFMTKAHQNTYAAPREIKSRYRLQTPILEEHKDYEFIEEDWKYHDSYAGNTWAPGREVIFYQDKPVWCMSYQGQTIDGLTEKFIETTFEFLKEALRNFDKNQPFRGPERFVKEDFEYKFTIKGDYKYFTGRESVFYKNKEVFFQDVMGTIIK